MQFTPFPPEAAEMAAERARASWAERQKLPAHRRHVDHSTAGMPCYRMPDGTLRPADYYRAAYPVGATPGTGTVHSLVKYDPTGRPYWDYIVTDFEPLEATANG